MENSVFEAYISFINKRKRLKKIFPSLVLLGAFATAYFIMLIAIVNKNAPVAFVCSLVILICSILLIAKPLTTNEKMSALDWIEVIAYLIISIVLISAYIFSSVPDDNKTIAVTILSTCIGGLIALYGTGITIKYSRIDKREDELKRIRPNIVPVSNNSWEHLSDEKKFSFLVDINESFSDLKRTTKRTNRIEFKPIRIANLGEAIVTVYGVLINGELIKFDYESVLIKNSFNELIINSYFDYSEDIEEIIMIVEDTQRNSYFANMRYITEKRKNSSTTKIEITSILDLRMIEENFNYLK